MQGLRFCLFHKKIEFHNHVAHFCFFDFPYSVKTFHTVWELFQKPKASKYFKCTLKEENIEWRKYCQSCEIFCCDKKSRKLNSMNIPLPKYRGKLKSRNPGRKEKSTKKCPYSIMLPSISQYMFESY